jgi:hypothetical protein
MAHITDLIRLNQSDAQWRQQLYDFIYAAKGRQQGILIDYIYEPPDHRTTDHRTAHHQADAAHG